MPEVWANVCGVISWWLICALAAERCAEIITTSDFFAPFRNALGRIVFSADANPFAYGIPRPLWKFVYLVSTCGWCCSVWCCIFFSLWLPGNVLSSTPGDPLHMFIPKVLCLIALANTWHAIFRRVHRGMVNTHDIKVVMEMVEGAEPAEEHGLHFFEDNDIVEVGE